MRRLKVVTRHKSNLGRVTVPKEWIGRTVEVKLLESDITPLYRIGFGKQGGDE